MHHRDRPGQDLVRQLEDHEGLLAEAVVAVMEAADPLLFSRYGLEGRHKCVQDTRFHLQHLAAALDIDHPDEFHEYRRWLGVVLDAHNVPAADIDANFAAIASVLAERYGRAADAAVRLLSSGRAPPETR